MTDPASSTGPRDTAALEYCLSARYGNTPVLRSVAGRIAPGEIVSLVGLSGSGKSTLALSLLRLLHYRGGSVEGSIRVDGREIGSLRERQLRHIRGKQIGYVPQSPAAALNPRLRVKTLLEETWRAHSHVSPAPDFFSGLLESVSLAANPDFLNRRASDLSTGQGQRLLIALAVMHSPGVLLADEPTSALDVITQAQVLRLFSDLNRQRGLAILFISHDLLSVASLSHRVQILNAGEIVETGTPGDIFSAPRHPFTRELVAAMPKPPGVTAV